MMVNMFTFRQHNVDGAYKKSELVKFQALKKISNFQKANLNCYR